MIIEKKIKLELKASVSTTGSSGKYLAVELDENSGSVKMIMEDIAHFLIHELCDIEESITSEEGIYIHIYADMIESE